ncbi:MAG: alpha/beta fold hydrolase [Bacteroidota bacterium]
MAKSERIKIRNQEGIDLDARLDIPLKTKTRAYAIFAHCFTCNKNLTAVRNISRALNNSGIAVLRFDFTGLGRSEGDFSDTNFSSNIQDLKDVARHLEEHYEAPSLMIGHSLGGTATVFAASEIESVRAVCTIGSPSVPEHVTHLFAPVADELRATGEAKLKIGLQEIKIKSQFLEDIQGQRIEDVLKRDHTSYLIIHSPQDTVVSIDNAAEMYRLLKHPKSFVSLDGADHMMSKVQDSEYAGQVIASWANRYLDLREESQLETGHQVAVRLNTSDIFTSDVRAGKHAILADEPSSVGGYDLGPSPYELVSAGLGACTVMTLHMYARRKKWDLQEVTVEIDHGKTHASDCEDCEETGKKIDLFQRKLSLIGDLDDAQRKRLLEIADKCPVHKTLESSSKVDTELMP